MQKFIKKIILFSVFFIVLNALYLYACIVWDWSFAKRVEALTMESPKYENIILGNSLAMDGMDSEVMSVHGEFTYNLSIGGASLKTNFIQLKEYLKIAGKNPKTVILGLGSYMNDFQREEIIPVVDFTMEGNHYGLKDLPMIKFRWIVFELIKKVIDPDHRNAKLNQGQLRIGRIVEDDTDYRNPLPLLPLKNYTDAEYLKKIAHLCRTYDIRLILIEMPGFKRTRNQTSIGPHKLSLDGDTTIDLYNLNNIHFAAILDAKRDWLGNSHLNKYGAAKFTQEMQKAIQD